MDTIKCQQGFEETGASYTLARKLGAKKGMLGACSPECVHGVIWNTKITSSGEMSLFQFTGYSLSSGKSGQKPQQKPSESRSLGPSRAHTHGAQGRLCRDGTTHTGLDPFPGTMTALMKSLLKKRREGEGQR